MLGSIERLKRKWLCPVEKSRVFQQYRHLAALDFLVLSVGFGSIVATNLSSLGVCFLVSRPHKSQMGDNLRPEKDSQFSMVDLRLIKKWPCQDPNRLVYLSWIVIVFFR